MDLIHIEDDERDADLVSRILNTQDRPPTHLLLKDGAAALEYFASASEKNSLRCKLILLDLKLPKVDGFDVLQQLKSNKQTASIPVVIFSASNINADIKRAYESGANSYLVKPDTYRELKDVVQDLTSYWIGHNLVK